MNFIALLRGLLGLCVLIGIAYLASNNRRAIRWRTVGAGLVTQIVLAILVIKGRELGAFFAPLGWPKAVFAGVGAFFVRLLDFTSEGARFVFGNLAVGQGQPGNMGVFFAFQVLPTIIFFSTLMSVLYYLGIMQRIVAGMAWLVARFLGTSGAETLSVTANIFVGQTEAPLFIRPFLSGMTHSEIMAVMTGGMATIAGGVMAAYIQMLGSAFAEAQHLPLEAARLVFAEHLLGASCMAAPAALLLAKIIIPETGQPVTAGKVNLVIEKNGENVIDAAARGAGDGLTLALNVGGMLIAFIALIAMLDYGISLLAGAFGYQMSLQSIFGFVLAPIAWLVGVPTADITSFGSLLGTKVVLNEFVAYLNLKDTIAAGTLLPKTVVMATYALCGFANFSSIAIQIGGIGPLAPERKGEIAQLALRAVLAGTLANLMTATIAGILMG